MEGGVLMVEIVKVNDTTVAKIGTQEIRQVFGKTQLVERKARIEEQLAEVNELLELFDEKEA